MSRREWEVWTRCEKCRDLATIAFWVRRDHRGRSKAALERSTTAALGVEDGALVLRHRPGHCGGVLRLLDPLPENTTLEA